MAGALTTVLVWVAGMYQIVVPEPVDSALVVLLTFVVSYMVKE